MFAKQFLGDMSSRNQIADTMSDKSVEVINENEAVPTSVNEYDHQRCKTATGMTRPKRPTTRVSSQNESIRDNQSVTQHSQAQLALSRSMFFNAVDEVGSRESQTNTTENTMIDYATAPIKNNKRAHLRTSHNLPLHSTNRTRCSSSLAYSNNRTSRQLGQNDIIERKSTKELFRTRLLNNRGRAQAANLSQRVFKRNDWNYRIQNSETTDQFRPPSHLPLHKQAEKILKDANEKAKIESIAQKNRARFIRISNLDVSRGPTT